MENEQQQIGTKKSQVSVGQALANGEYVAMSMGEFLSTVVDGSGGDIVILRETARSEPDEAGMFVLRMEVHLVPASRFPEHQAEIGCKLIHNRLHEMISRGYFKGLVLKE